MNRANKIFMIANTHFDPVWLWTWDEAMASIRATFRSALDRMNEEEQFIYSFSCPPVFEWIKNTDHKLFEEIRQRISEGRWNLAEAMWVQADCYSACGESYVRQCLYAQKYYEENFGVMSNTAFNVDAFGHSLMLPQILKKCGISNYMFCRPEPDDVPLPSGLFRWESPDGSRVMAYRISEYSKCFSCETAKEISAAMEKIDEIGHDIAIVYGVTNHGGAPTKKAISEIVQKQEETGRVVFSTPERFFAEQQGKELPVVNNELPVRFFGVYGNMPMEKKANRTVEKALENAERAAWLCSLLFKSEYPLQTLSGCWKDALFNQFHDILGGASIEQAYSDARNLNGRAMQTANEILHYSLQRISGKISLPPEAAADSVWNLVYFNLNTFGITVPLEAEIQWAWEFDWYRGEICVTDESGREYSCQLITPTSVIPGFRSRIVFTAELPAMGYKTFRVHQRAAKNITDKRFRNCNNTLLENEKIRVKIDPLHGGIESILDVRTGEVLCKACACPLVLGDTSDVWAFNFNAYGEKEYFSLESSEIYECGAERTSVKTTAYYGRSRIEQTFTIYHETQEIEGSYCVDWQERCKTLKLIFEPRTVDPTIRAATPYSAVIRDFDGKELPVGEWLDISGSSFGVTLMWDGIFAYDTEEKTIRATVLRSPICGDLHIEDIKPLPDFRYLSQGITTGKWKMSFYKKKDLREIWQQSKAFLNPPVMILESNHKGDLPTTSCFLRLCGEDVWITACKQSENGKGQILRMQNLSEMQQTVEILRNSTENSGKIVLKPYEIKTLFWADKKAPFETDMLENATGEN